MNRIMFVCHGNICRSPMAEYITKHIVRRLGKEKDYLIASSATSQEEHGSPIYPPASRVLSRHGIPHEHRCAVLLDPMDYGKYDVFALMDDRNLRNITRIFKDDREGKVHKLLSFVGESRDVIDPWYSGDFEAAYNDILEGCIGLLIHLDPTLTRDMVLSSIS